MPLKKGQTNNPHGRPRKDNSLTELLSRYGNKKVKIPEEKKDNPDYKEMDGMKLKDALAKRLWQLAIFEKDVPSIKYIFDRIDGKPVHTLVTEVDRGDMTVFRAAQKELFSKEELDESQNEGYLEPPEETGTSAGE